MMLDLLPFVTYLLVVLMGGLLAILTTAGLWWTVQNVSQSTRPLRLYAVSAVIRLLLVLLAFYGVLQQLDAVHLLMSLAGFTSVRLLIVNSRISLEESESHE